MVKLFCAIVGVLGNAFEVWVDEGDSVGHLKKAIEKMPQFPADQLQLFLAKKEDSAWLTKADVENDANIKDSLAPLDDVGAPLCSVGLSEEEVRLQATNEHVLAKTTSVHVLVAAPNGAGDDVALIGHSEPRISIPTRHPERLKRWAALNEMIRQKNLDENEKMGCQDSNRKRQKGDFDRADAAMDVDLVGCSAPPTAIPDRHPERLKRWAAINEVIRQKNQDEDEMVDDEDSTRNRSKGDLDDWVSSSNLSLDDLEPILSMETFDLPAKTVPDEVVEQLHAQLAQLRQLYGDIYTGNDAKRRVFIAAVLEAVCLLLDDVIILVDEEVTGKNVHVHDRFEFVLKRGKKKIPVVQVQRDRIPEGIAANVAGLEALCDVEGLEQTIGIATNYINWFFISDDDEKIRWIDESLGSSMPSKESLKKVLGKICGVLSISN